MPPSLCVAHLGPGQVLEMARASRDAHVAENEFAESKLRESIQLVQFYSAQVERTQQRVTQAEQWVGQVRARMRHAGISTFQLNHGVSIMDVVSPIHQMLPFKHLMPGVSTAV